MSSGTAADSRTAAETTTQVERAAAEKPALHQPVNPVRFVTAASLFDGHDRSEEHSLNSSHPV